MKPIFHSFVLISIIAGVALSQPKAKVDKYEIDLGSMYTGEKKMGKISLKNIGNDTLHIYYVGASCGCTAVKSPKEFLPPGQSDDIDFEFSPYETQGTAEKYIMIYTNDTTAKTLNIKLTAHMNDVLQPIAGSNLLTIIENAIARKPVTKRIAMKNVSGSPITIRRDSVSSASISATMDKKRLRPDDTLHIDITVLPEQLGLSNEALYIFTDRKATPSAEVKITIFGTQGN